MNKKLFKSVISVFLVFLFLFSALPVSFAAESSYYYEDFENFNLETFTANTDNYKLAVGKSDTGNCLDIHVNKKGNATTKVQYVTYKNLSMEGEVTINFDFMTSQAFNFEAFFNDGKQADIFSHLADGRGSFAGDYSTGTRSPVWYEEKGGENIVRENEWYSVTVTLDLITSTYKYAINGKPGKNLKNGYTEVFETIQLPANSTTLTGFGIVGIVDGMDISIDNIEIYSGDLQSSTGNIKTGLGHKLTAFGVLDSVPDETEKVTKAQFAKMLLKSMGFNSVDANSQVSFSDIANHPERAFLEHAVALGILNGKGDGTLGPDDIIDIGAACKMAVSALGAQDMAVNKGGYIVGYLTVAKAHDLLDYIDASEPFTYKQAMLMIWNFLKASPLDMYGQKMDPVMYQYKSISYLKGEVTRFDSDSLYMTLDVTEENGDDVSKTKIFRIPKEYASYNWDGTIIEIYMDYNFNVIYLEPYQDSSSRYGYLYSVNDKMDSSSVSAASINRITLFDGTEYDSANDMELCVNGNPVYSAVLTNAFVHLVLEDNQIKRMNIINDRVDSIFGNMLLEGGIINSISDDEIRFTTGENNYGLITNADSGSYTVVVNGVSGTFKQLKKGMLFDYKINSDGSYFFVVTNKSVSGTVKEYSSDVIVIGDIECSLSNGSVYIQESGEDYYKTDYPIGSLLGMSVNALLDPKGNIRYIQINEDAREFYGVVCGSRKGTGLSDLRELLIYTKKGEEVFSVSEKLDDSYGFVDFDTAAANARDISGAGVYKFYKNLKGEITGIESINWIDSAPKTVSTIGDNNIIGKLGTYYIERGNIFSLTDINGEFSPKAINWATELQTAYVHPSVSCKVLFSEHVEDEFYSRIAVITQGYETLYVNASDKFGYITKVSKIMDGKDETGLKVFTRDLKGKENIFVIPADRMYFNINSSTETYKKDAFIHYTNPKNGTGLPVIMDYLDLNLPVSDWASVGNKFGTRLEHYGTFDKIRNNEIYCTLNGTTKGMYMRPNTKVNGYVYDDKENGYVAVPVTDLIGKDVWCITTRSYIVAVILPRVS